MPSSKTVITTAGIVAALVIIGIITMYLSRGGSAPVPAFGPIELPKAPHWDAAKKCLFFVDVYNSSIHRYDPSTKEHTRAQVGGPNDQMAFIIPLDGTDNQFIVSLGPNLAIVTWDGKSTTVSDKKIWKPIGDNVYRANEGKVSPSGNLFVGGHSPFQIGSKTDIQMNKAALYIFDKFGNSKIALSNVTVANGMAWSKDHTKFYFIDSLAYTVSKYSYNIVDDSLTDGTVLINFKDAKIPGVPDGMAIDSEDKLWVTSFQGHQVIRLDPETRSVMQTIPLDAYQVTSAAFAGPNLKDLYLTTGRYNMDNKTLEEYPHSGYIFEQKDFTVTGRPGVSFQIRT